jgi:hypothetical protein
VGLTDTDLDTEFDVGAEIGMGRTSLRKIIQKLNAVYLGPMVLNTTSYGTMPFVSGFFKNANRNISPTILQATKRRGF